MRDEDYDRGYSLGAGDIAARLAMYDLEQAQTNNRRAWRERIDRLIEALP